MKKTYKYQLPQNKNVICTDVRVENNEILVDVEFKEKFEPKDGDFLCAEGCGVFIYNGKQGTLSGRRTLGAYLGLDYRGAISECQTENKWAFMDKCRYATEQEKSNFLERLEKERHERWNAETKQLEEIRWMPKAGDIYWFISYDGDVCRTAFSEIDFFDRSRISANNCFKTKEAAQPYAEQIKEILKNSKSE